MEAAFLAPLTKCQRLPSGPPPMMQDGCYYLFLPQALFLVCTDPLLEKFQVRLKRSAGKTNPVPSRQDGPKGFSLIQKLSV